MANASGSRVALGYIFENTLGTTPATPQLKAIPFQSFNGSPSSDLITDPSIRSDRQQRFTRQGNVHVDNELVCSLAHETYDDFLEAALLGQWTANVLKVGTGVTAHTSMTVEKAHQDVGQYFQFRGMVPTSFKLDVPSTGVVTATFGLVGMSASNTTATIDTSAGYTAPPSKEPFVHLGGTFKLGGVSIGFMTSINFTLENGYEAQYGLGSGSAFDMTYKMAQLTGQATTYFQNAAQYTQLIGDTPTSIEFTLTDGTNDQTYLIDNVKLNTVDIPVANDGPVIQTINFTGLYSNTTGTILQITRSA